MRFSKEERIVLEAEPGRKEQALGGPPPVLDTTQMFMLNLYWALRRSTPGDQPISLGWDELLDYDQLVLHILQSADAEYLGDIADKHSAMSREMKSKSLGATAKGRRKH